MEVKGRHLMAIFVAGLCIGIIFGREMAFQEMLDIIRGIREAAAVEQTINPERFM